MIPSLSDIHKLLDSPELQALPPLRVRVLRNVMVEPLEPFLRFFAWRAGFNAQVRFGEYDNIVQEAAGANAGLLDAETDVVLVFAKLETLSPELACQFPTLATERIQAETERVASLSAGVLAGIRRQTQAMILWHGFELPAYPALGVLDPEAGQGQTAVVQGLNAMLRQSLREAGNAHLVDMDLCLRRIGAERFFDPRYWHLGKAPYSREALQAIAQEDFAYIRALKGRARKCLVLDCDGILWGGVVGEDGLTGIKLGHSHPGSCHRELQQEALNLFHRGVLLALCSKNNEADVWEVFDRHPDMVLRREHLAAALINWRDKAANLRQIALDLNIGLDSLVFVDDSEFEVQLVRDVLPEVEALHFPRQSASSFKNMLAAAQLFDTLTLSEEDRRRGAMYVAEGRRHELKAQATDMRQYYASLRMQAEIGLADPFTIPRIAQMTQKTNQFNLTTRRHSDAEIRAFSESADYDVAWLKLTDIFGDSGIVGAAIVRYQGQDAVFESFLLSCRVIGRGVEDLFLARLLERARASGAVRAVGLYIPTPKNAQVAGFYPAHGFVRAAGADGEERFELDLSSASWKEPDYFDTVTCNIAPAR